MKISTGLKVRLFREFCLLYYKRYANYGPDRNFATFFGSLSIDLLSYPQSTYSTIPSIDLLLPYLQSTYYSAILAIDLLNHTLNWPTILPYLLSTYWSYLVLTYYLIHEMFQAQFGLQTLAPFMFHFPLVLH